MTKERKIEERIKYNFKKYYQDLRVDDESLQLLGRVLPRKSRKVDKKEEKKRI